LYVSATRSHIAKVDGTVRSVRRQGLNPGIPSRHSEESEEGQVELSEIDGGVEVEVGNANDGV
jgi:hypothetical protein